jgi:ribosomal protein L37AE/L43A
VVEVSHQPPFFCPYCGEEDLRPHGESHGEWSCEACRRVFVLRTIRPGAERRADQAEVTR